MQRGKPMVFTFKEALQEDLRNSRVPSRVVAEELEMSYSMLMNAANPDLPAFNFQARKLGRFAQVTGGRYALSFLVSQVNCVLLPLPDVPVSFERIDELVSSSVKEFGDVLTEVGKALADHRVTRLEAKRLSREIDEQVATVMALKTELLALAGDELFAKAEQVLDVSRGAEVFFGRLKECGLLSEEDELEIHIRQQAKVEAHGHHKPDPSQGERRDGDRRAGTEG